MWCGWWLLRQVKRFTPSILPEERRAIMRKAKTRSKNRSEQRLEIAAKKQGVTKSQIVRAPTRIKVKQGSGSESCDYTKSADAMALRHKCWTLDSKSPLIFILQHFKFDNAFLSFEETRIKQKKKASQQQMRTR